MSPFQAAVETHLTRTGRLTEAQLQQARALQGKTGCTLGKALWSLNLVGQSEYLRVVSTVSGCPIFTEWLGTSGVPADFTLARTFEPTVLSQLGFNRFSTDDLQTMLTSRQFVPRQIFPDACALSAGTTYPETISSWRSSTAGK